MHSAGTNRRAKGRWNIADVGPRFGSTKLAAAAIRGALTLAVISAVLLIAARPAQAQTEKVIYNFCSQPNCSDGGGPSSNLIFDGAGNLYGIAIGGGLFFAGTVFELSPNGNGGWNETVLYTFTGGADGATPNAPLVFDSEGNLYGTTYAGGANGYGVVFELSLVGASWNETVLYSFTGGVDGPTAGAPLIFDSEGNLYGTTWANSGPTGYETVFELSPSGGNWTQQMIYGVDTASSSSGVTVDTAGNLYCATRTTVFELSPNGNGGWTSAVIHTFCAGKDACLAQTSPVLDKAGNLYGTTMYGGANDYGTVYELSPGTKGKWTERILHSFRSFYDFPKDGSIPSARIIFDKAGNIYGTTLLGGQYNGGTVFELSPNGKGYRNKFLWEFSGGDGDNPFTSLILDSAGHLYGTTYTGGPSRNGVAYEVNPSPAVTTTTLTSSPNPSTYGQAVTFTAVITSSAGAPPDGETVSFEHGLTVLGTALLSGGSASFTTSTLKVGTPAVKAVYGGDFNFRGGKSNTVTQVVTKP